VNRVLVFFLILYQTAVCAEGTTKITDKPQIPLINGISSRLIPEQSETITYPETYFSFGIYREFLTEGTQENYTPAGLGVMLGFDQHIRGIWSGGIEVRWSDWKTRTNSYADTSPLSIFSKVSATPNLNNFIHNDAMTKMFRPYATGGLGYTLFFDNRSLLAAQTKSAFGQFSATYGGGLKIIFPLSISVKLGIEQWRGIQTSSYFSNIVFLELGFGDVDKF
jgi:hypothetical protein